MTSATASKAIRGQVQNLLRCWLLFLLCWFQCFWMKTMKIIFFWESYDYLREWPDKNRDPSPGNFGAHFLFSSQTSTTYPGVYPTISSLALRPKLGLQWLNQVSGPILGGFTRSTKLDAAPQVWGLKILSLLLIYDHGQGPFTQTRIIWIDKFFTSKMTKMWNFRKRL